MLSVVNEGGRKGGREGRRDVPVRRRGLRVGGSAVEHDDGAVGVLPIVDIGAVVPRFEAEDGGGGGPDDFGHVADLEGREGGRGVSRCSSPDV